MENILDKIKPVMEKVKPVMEKVLAFLKEHKRYVGVICLFVCMVITLVFFTGDKFNATRIAKENSKTVSGEDYVPDAEFEVNAHEDVNALITKYFTAYVNADIATLETLATPISDKEKSYITTMSQFYEAYQNVTCYTKHGLSKDSYIVSVTFDIKFVGYDVTAPSMILFYVQTAEDGSLYINNLYSDFNMMYQELAINKDVYTALRKYTTTDDYLELYNQVETAFNTLIKSNTEIYTLTKRTIPGTRQLWEDTVYYVEQETETQTETETETQTETETETQTETETETQQPTVEKIKIVNVESSARVRSGAGTSYDQVGDAYNGDIFVKLGEVTNDAGETWIKIQFNDSTVGYVRSDFTQAITE